MNTHFTRNNIAYGDTSPVGTVMPSFIGQVYAVKKGTVFIAKALNVNGWHAISAVVQSNPGSGLPLPFIEPVWEVKINSVSATCNSINGLIKRFKRGNEAWQESNVFNGLTGNTPYTFYGEYVNGEIVSHEYTTPKQNQITPEIPVLVNATAYELTVSSPTSNSKIYHEGTEYNTPHTFTNLRPETSYAFKAVMSENNSSNPSYSEDIIFSTTKAFGAVSITGAWKSNFPILLEESSVLYGAGENNHGELGLGTSANVNRFTQIPVTASDIAHIASGQDAVFLTKTDGTLLAAGSGSFSTTNGSSNVFRPDTRITNVLKVATSGNHNMVINKSGQLYATGYNGEGQCGLGSSSTSYSTYSRVSTFSSGVTDAACGAYSSHVIYSGQVYGCGANMFGELGLGDKTKRTSFVRSNITSGAVKIVSGEYHTLVLTDAKKVFGSGYNTSGVLGELSNYDTSRYVDFGFSNVKDIACGAATSFILQENGKLWACGTDSYGGLASGTAGTTYKQTTLIAEQVDKMAVCEYSTFIIKKDGSLWATGRNNSGQLGLGDNENRLTWTKVLEVQKPLMMFSNASKVYIQDNSIAVSNMKMDPHAISLFSKRSDADFCAKKEDLEINSDGVYQIIRISDKPEEQKFEQVGDLDE